MDIFIGKSSLLLGRQNKYSPMLLLSANVFYIWTQLLKDSCLWRFTFKIFFSALLPSKKMDSFRTNIFIRLFQVRWHFHSITWDLFPSSPQGDDNLSIVLKHSWFSLLPYALNISLVSSFLHSLYKSQLYYDLNWYNTSVSKIKHFEFHFDFTS